MPRVQPLRPADLSPELAAIWDRYVTTYGAFEGQLEVFAHVPAALRHLMPMLMELRRPAACRGAPWNWRSSSSRS